MNLNEVAPPGWGHTKAEKEKTKPDKPKSKIGGTAAAFKRALDDGRFKGLPGSTTKKEKTADMFKLMYSMKKKGAKPHYKPGTDKKYKKYQEETSMPNVEKKDRGAIKKRFKGLFKKDVKGTVQGVNEGDLHKKMNTFKTDATKRKSDNSLGTISSATKRYEMLRKIIGSKKKPTKPAIKEEKDKKLTKIVKQLRKSVKSHGKQADYIEKINGEKNCGCGQTPCKTYGKKNVKEESNPRIPRKRGQPANSKKHSDLYTDENPKGTIHGLGFKDVATAKTSVSKIRNSSRSHAHKIQAAVAMEQRAREMGKTSEAAIYRKFINTMKEKTKRMNK